MYFSVIYTVDVPRDTRLHPYLPRNRKPWQQTEGNEGYEYSYLEGCWSKGKHRKLCGLLTRRQFEAFLRDTCLCASSVETMGMIGAPGDGYGIQPAIAFDLDDSEALVNAYVCPVPDAVIKGRRKSPLAERDWERVKAAVIKLYR